MTISTQSRDKIGSSISMLIRTICSLCGSIQRKSTWLTRAMLSSYFVWTPWGRHFCFHWVPVEFCYMEQAFQKIKKKPSKKIQKPLELQYNVTTSTKNFPTCETLLWSANPVVNPERNSRVIFNTTGVWAFVVLSSAWSLTAGCCVEWRLRDRGIGTWWTLADSSKWRSRGMWWMACD